MVGADLERLVPAHEETGAGFALVPEDLHIPGAALLPLGLLPGLVHTVQLGPQLEHGLLVCLTVRQLHQRQRDDGLVVRVVRGVRLFRIVSSGRRVTGGSCGGLGRLIALGRRRRPLRLLPQRGPLG